MVTTAVVFVKDEAFVRMVGTGGDANKHVVMRMRQMQLAAIVEAPMGAPRRGEAHVRGNLKLSHRRTGVIKQGPLRAVGTVYNNAGYAAVVHQGYPGYIFPKRHFMVIPISSWNHYTGQGLTTRRGGTHFRRRKKVKGQSGNDWLDRACTAIARLDA